MNGHLQAPQLFDFEFLACSHLFVITFDMFEFPKGSRNNFSTLMSK